MFRTHQVRINGKLSKCKAVISGIPQGTVLGPLLFVIFINDMPQFCGDTSNLYSFADDAKMCKHIKNNTDSDVLRDCCQKICKWSEKWLMRLNIDKCKVLSIAHNKKSINYKHSFITSDNK